MLSQTDLNLRDMQALLPNLLREDPAALEGRNPNLITLSDRILHSSLALNGRATSENFRHTMLHTLLQRFAHETRTMDEKQLARATSSAVRFHQGKLADRTLVLPLHLESIPSDEPVELGPVRLLPLTAFAVSSQAPDGIENWIGQADSAAEVTIPNCDEPMARLRAGQAVERARDIIRLLAAQTTDNLSLQPGQKPHWHQITASLPADVIAGFSMALFSITDPACDWPLAARLLDAVSWYGIAVREGSVAAAITLWVNALERLAMTRDHMRITDCVAKRTALLAAMAEKGASYNSYRPAADDLYAVRCALVHGAASPFDSTMPAHALKAEHTTRAALFGALEFFRRIGMESRPFTAKAMEKAYRAMEKKLET